MSDYPTCRKTFATLRIYHDTVEPPEVTAVLGIKPTDFVRRGDTHGPSNRAATYKINGWFLSSENTVSSQDSLRHIEWLLPLVEPRRSQLGALREQGHRMEISCYWLSASGHGGPTLTPDVMRRVAELGLGLSFDVYFGGRDEEL
jgi:hypothetical protein